MTFHTNLNVCIVVGNADIIFNNIKNHLTNRLFVILNGLDFKILRLRIMIRTAMHIIEHWKSHISLPKGLYSYDEKSAFYALKPS